MKWIKGTWEVGILCMWFAFIDKFYEISTIEWVLSTITTNNDNNSEWSISKTILKLKISFTCLCDDEQHRLKSLSQFTLHSFAFILKNTFSSIERCQFIHEVFVFDVNDKYWTILYIGFTFISHFAFSKCVL